MAEQPRPNWPVDALLAQVRDLTTTPAQLQQIASGAIPPIPSIGPVAHTATSAGGYLALNDNATNTTTETVATAPAHASLSCPRGGRRQRRVIDTDGDVSLIQSLYQEASAFELVSVIAHEPADN